MRKILILIFILTTPVLVFSKSGIFEQLSSSYKKAKSIEVEFKNEDDSMNGTLIADKSGKYLIKTNSRTICSDRKSIWNFSKDDNKVIISDYEESGDISIENVFFDFADNYAQKSETKESGYTVLYLTPKKKSGSAGDVKLFVTPSDLQIKKIVFISNYGEDSWKILKIEKNAKIPSGTFDFKAPKDVQVIDLR
ncbi:MAG: outer membrane lipoprotein carrier protein LolA [bacterium]